jgi:hypothetical protein
VVVVACEIVLVIMFSPSARGSFPGCPHDLAAPDLAQSVARATSKTTRMSTNRPTRSHFPLVGARRDASPGASRRSCAPTLGR